MNNDFMFSERNTDPYEDNAAYLTKIFTPKRFIILSVMLALCCAALLAIAAVNYGMFDFTHGISSSTGRLITEARTLCGCFSLLAVISGVFIAALVLSAVKASRAGGRKFTALSPALFLIGSALTAGVCIFAIAAAFVNQTELYKIYHAANAGYNNLLMSNAITIAPYFPIFFLLLMSLFGIVFYISVIRTIKGRGLFLTGASGFKLTAFLAFGSVIISGGLYTVIFTSHYPLVICLSISVLTALIAAPFLYISLLIGRYRKGVRFAERAIKMGGVNLYMGGDSKSANYYQSTYHSPDFFVNENMDNAPQSAEFAPPPAAPTQPAPAAPMNMPDVVTDTTPQLTTDTAVPAESACASRTMSHHHT